MTISIKIPTDELNFDQYINSNSGSVGR